MDRVRKQFANSVLAVEDMSVAIDAGEFVSFLGPSGCGKSTALRMIAGLLPVTAGSIAIEPATARAEHDLGFVFQEPTLMPWASVFDNVRLPLRLSGLSRAEAAPRVEAALLEVGLARFAQAYPRELFRNWDFITYERLDGNDYPDGNVPLLASQSIGMNVLSLSESKIVVQDVQTPLIKSLEKHGFEPIPCQWRHGRVLGGGFHCMTLDIRREGELVDYGRN